MNFNRQSKWGPWLMSVTTALGAMAALHGSAAAEARRPNIIVIVGDDMGYADLGVHGCRDIATPHLDALAQSGVRCSQGYVSGPYCSPTRAGLLTGRYQQRFGHEFNPGAAAASTTEVGLPLSERTLADYLKQAGYRTALVGKWHLGNGDKFHPQSRGFEEYFGFLGGAHPYLPVAGATRRQNSILRGRDVVEEREYLTDALAREAVDYLARHHQEPYFLYLAFNAVHTPLQATDKYLERCATIADPRRRSYAAMMMALDDAVGRVRAKIQELQQEEQTLIFFFSDNGGPPANASNNGALRGHKATTWEGGVRVPFFVSWKGRIPAGQTYDQPIIQLDVLPTALAAAGVAVPESAKLDGVNLLPYLTGEKMGPPHERLYWRFGPQWAIRSGDWKLVRANGAETPLLIHLAQDVGESRDRSADEPARREQLAAAWQAWNQELVDPLWRANRAAGQRGQAAKGAGAGKAKGKSKKKAAVMQ